MTVLGGKALLSGVNDVNGGELGLWETDGTAAGTQELTGITGAAPSGIAPRLLTAFNGEIVFNGSDASHKHELWVTDGTVAGTHELTVAGSQTSATGFDPSGFEVYNGEVLFNGVDSSGNRTLWETDGTSAGTRELIVANASATGLDPLDLTSALLANDSILFQNASGQAAIWNLNGIDVSGGGAVTPNPGPAWTAVGRGDFNNDGHADLLWQNANGQAAIWEMNGTTLIGGGAVSLNPGPTWKAIGAGDFNGGRLFRHPVAEFQWPGGDLGNGWK